MNSLIKKYLRNDFFSSHRFRQLSDCQGEICENVLNNPKVYNNFLTKAVKKIIYGVFVYCKMKQP